MTLTLFMAMSLNGYIADKDDQEDFLSLDGWNMFVELAETAGVFITGRRTYEIVRNHYKDHGFMDVHADRIIVTTQNVPATAGYHIAHSPQAALDLAKNLGHRNALLIGGSKLNAAFLKQKLVNKVVFNIEPVIVAGGVPVVADFAPKATLATMPLTFQRCIKRGHDVMQLHYTVNKPA